MAFLRTVGEWPQWVRVDDSDLEWAVMAAGPRGWHVTDSGYAACSLSGGRSRYLHRYLVGLEAGDPRKVDHINRNTLDNRRSNLRVVTHAQNHQNLGGGRGNSRYRNVSYDPRREHWLVTLRIDGKRIFIGSFADEDEAGRAAAEARRLHMPYSSEALEAA